jgi:fatty-acyl-CoA synthase
MMGTRHYEFWPDGLAKSLPLPKTSLYDNLKVAAQGNPDKTAIHYYGTSITYKRLQDEVDSLAGFLQSKLDVVQGDRVLLYMQNSPQFIIGYYAILRANAVVVPINPMSVTDELEVFIDDCGAKVALVGQELFERISPLLKRTALRRIIVTAYSDYCSPDFDLGIPEVVSAPRTVINKSNVIDWQEALSAGLQPGPLTVSEEDMALLPYTSGTTGKPKGCVHTHGSTNAPVIGSVEWNFIKADMVCLSSLPLFHVTGMQHSMNAPIYVGGTIVLMTRWDRDAALALIDRYACTHWMNVPFMVTDVLESPNLNNYSLKSLTFVGGGGASLPKAVGEKLYQLLGIRYSEGYGLTETIAQTHLNPPHRSKFQCLGIPTFDVDARIINYETLEELGPGQAGEIVLNGPQVMKEYWNRPEDTKEVFITIDGKQFLRTGDIAFYDEEGYFFMVDRIKRMINASGFKIWPAEVESIMYKHPAVKHACVIGVKDTVRGETAKAYVILHEDMYGKVKEDDIIQWSKSRMSSYKYPRIIEFVDNLPMSANGKVLWRKLEEQERHRELLTHCWSI